MQIGKKVKSPFNDLMVILLVLAIGSLLVFYIGSGVSRGLYFFGVIMLFLILRDHVLGFAILFIMIMGPWGMFQYKPDDIFIPLSSTMGLQFQPFFSIALFAKIYYHIRTKRKNIKNYLFRFYPPFFYYLLFLLFIGLLFGHSILSLYWTFHGLPHHLIFLTVPVMFMEDELVRFNKIIFYFTLAHILISLLELMFPGSVLSFFQGGGETIGIGYGEGVTRVLGGIGLSIYSLIVATYYLIRRDKVFNPYLLYLVSILSLFFIWQSATRGWMIASTFFIFSIFTFYSGKIIGGRNFFILALIVVLFILFTPQALKKNFQGATNRLMTVESLVSGDATAEGTLKRVTERAPRVLNQFKKSPVFGFGFSHTTRQFYDGHVALPSLLLLGGIMGLLIFIYTFIRIILFLFRVDRYYTLKGVFVFGLAIIAFLIINATSRKMIGYHMVADAAFMLAMFFAHFNARMANIKQVN